MFHLRYLFKALTFWVVVAFILSGLTLEATDESDFYGFWEIQEPAGDTCVVIIKKGGRLSCFWSGSSSNQIVQGSWKMEDDKLIATWDSGYQDVFEKVGTNGVIRSSYDSNMSLSDEPTLRIRGVRVDNRIPGSLTSNENGEISSRTKPEILDPKNAPAIPIRNAYTGYWQINQSSGIFGIGGGSDVFYLNLERDGTATTALRNWEAPEGMKGEWEIKDNKVLIDWENGQKDKLQEGEEGFILQSYKKTHDFNDRPSSVHTAAKMNAIDAVRYFNAGELQKLTVADIRGTWTPRNPTGSREYIEIEGWGNAYRYPSNSGQGTDPGKWRLNDDEIIITWVDGTKDVIRYTFPDFIKDSYAPGEPITGSPRNSIQVVKSAEIEP